VSLLSSNKNQLICGSHDATISIWDLETGPSSRHFEAECKINSMAFVHDTHVITAHTDFLLRLWDLKTGQRVREFNGHEGNVNAVVFLKSLELIMSGSTDTTIRVWSLDSSECIKTLGSGTIGSVSMSIKSLATSIHNSMVFSGSSDRSIRVWDVTSYKCVRTLYGHMGEVLSLCMDGEGDLYSGASDGQIRIWNCDRGECLQTLSIHSASVQAIILGPGGQCISAGAGMCIYRLVSLCANL
jgi:WD40 repeat protein